jgi:hypothetical protein
MSDCKRSKDTVGSIREPLVRVFGLVVLMLLLYRSAAAGQQAKSEGPVSRECTLTQPDPRGKKTSKPSKRKAGPQIELVPVCSEVRDSALATQEYLQKYVREQRWTLSDEQVSEDMWTFTLEFGKEELARYAKLAPDARIDWNGGKALINVRTNSLDDGYARIVVTVRLDAYGEPQDRFVPQPKSWPVPSSGSLEAALLSALRVHLEAVR